ncbi:hypothetical protein Dsin_028193 [Dipteronia sinensis]|uniref:RNase H type-1 domain-containing protein n=1 Tax=Dipteronia sinensis TaxID=43782 RepID=A0AAD9ZRA1_9ROSI|nr:hypothetical protein Dsin_028193 [Dipteronia sinensis]
MAIKSISGLNLGFQMIHTHGFNPLLSKWQSAQVISISDDLPSADNGLVRWKRPRFGWVKCNVDGAVFSHLNRLGFGWVIRDVDGQMLAASNGLLAGPLDAGLAEALSFREALSWLKAHSFSKAIMETDALKVVQALKSQASDPNYFGLIIDECKVFLKDITDCNVCYVRMSANNAAHSLARASCSVSDVHVWGSVPPFFSL